MTTLEAPASPPRPTRRSSSTAYRSGGIAMACAFGFAFLWALMEMFASRLAETYDIMQIEWVRYGIHLVLMLGLWGRRGPVALVRTQRPLFHLSRSLILLAMSLSYVAAAKLGASSGTVSALFWLFPFVTLGLARWLLSERVPKGLWIAVGAGWLGGLVMHHPAWPDSLLPLAPAMAMTASFAMFLIMSRTLREEALPAKLFYIALGPFVALMPFMPQVWLHPPLHDLLLLIGIGLAGFVALVLIEKALHIASASRVASVLPMHLVFLSLMGSALNASLPGLRAWVGMAVIVAATLWLWRRERTRAASLRRALPLTPKKETPQ